MGDLVETDENFIFRKVIQPSGQITFRVWFGSQNALERQKIVQEIETMKPLMEWSSENLLALSALDEVQAQELANYLHVSEGRQLLEYETGRTQ